MQNIIVIGSGGHAGAVIDVIETEGKYKIEAILCDYAKPGNAILGYPVLGKVDVLLKNNLPHIGIVAVGDNYYREKKVERILSLCPEFKFVTTIHPSAIVSRHSLIEQGVIIQAGAIVKNSTKVGAHCNINVNASVGHDVVLGDYSLIGPNVFVGGFGKVGRGSAVNIGAVIRDRVEVGEYSVVGMGSIVTKNIPSYVTVYGSPARIVRARGKEDGFL
jgi:sugar O-acyltransferase (sialic acid O-acetyltransferase NeuD family)